MLGLKLEFSGDPPIKHNSYVPQFSKEGESEIDLEIQKFLVKGVITNCEHETGEYISPIFIRQRSDGSWGTPERYLASLDLKDAYYSVPTNPDHTMFLKFIWKNQLHKFLVLPNDLCCGPRKLAKLMKPPIATLILDGHIIAIYIDDLINIGLTFDACVENIIASIKLLNLLGFVIHPNKSTFLAKQEIKFLGFNI